MKDYRHRYSWLTVDGKRLQIIAMTETKNKRGLVRFQLPEEYHKYLGLCGIEIEPATCTEADEYYHRKVEQIGRIVMPEAVDCQARRERMEGK